MFPIARQLSAFAFFLTALFASATTTNLANAQRLLPNQDLETALSQVQGKYGFAELAGASNVIGDDAYGLFFSPPSHSREWDMQAQNYRLLLALTQEEEGRDIATVLAAAAALNGGREDHAEALAQQALTLIEDETTRSIAIHILDVVNDKINGDYPYTARDRIWTLSRQVGVFGPYASSTSQDGEYARLCADFSYPVQASHRVDYRDLVTVTPAPPIQRFVVFDGGYRLCVVGATFETAYEITLGEGLLSKRGFRQRESVTFNVTTPGRKAEVHLPSRGYTLPANGSQMVPIETVNIESLVVGLYHLDERNIGQMLREGTLVQNAYDIGRYDGDYRYMEGGTSAFSNDVRPVFEGTLSVDMLKHQRRRDGISIADMLDGPAERGLYLLTVKRTENSSIDQVKWIMMSDLALTTVDTPEGLFINAIDTRSGLPLFEGVDVQLVTRGNRVMAPIDSESATTAFFAAAQLNGKNADAPAYLYASHPELGDAFLALGRAPIEIETQPGLSTLKTDALELWAKADRGQYREGEVARVAGLLRQTQSNDLDVLLPKTLLARFINPQGEVVDQFDIDLSNGLGFETEVTLPFGARQGRWSLDLTLGRGMPVLKSVGLRVADFVPPSVEIDIAPVETLALDGSDQVAVQVDYLYGAPALNLNVSLSGMLQPVSRLEGFNVGLEQEEFVYSRPFDLIQSTDSDGTADFTIPAFTLPDQTALAKVTIDAVVTDAAGRKERTSATASIARDTTLIGVKPAFDVTTPVAEGSEVAFTLAALTGEGTLLSSEAVWTLYQENYDYNWYFDGGRWNYESSYIDLPVAEGTLTLDGETALSVEVDWGAYRLEVVSGTGEAATSVRFNAGWRALPQIDRAPGRLGVAISSDRPSPGDTVDMVIDTPHAGAGLAYLVGSETKVIDLGQLAAGSNSLSITVPSTWGDVEGLWVLPIVYSNGAIGADRLPSRAVGAHFIGFDQKTVLLDVVAETQDEVRSRSALSIPVSIGPLNDGESGFALAWLVDDGVLSMTGYQAPNPAAHFLSAYALPADLRDTFAALIASEGINAAPLKQGFDGMFMTAMRASMADEEAFSLAQGLTTRIKETLALSSSVVALSPNGTADLSFDLPDFVGRGRLMTMAWTDQGRLGASSETLVVRDPVVADLFLPRFLAPGDQVDVKLLLSNTQDSDLSATVTMTMDEGLSLIEGAKQMIFDLSAKGQQTIPLRFGANNQTGPTQVTIEVALANESLTRNFPIEVRAAAPRDVFRDSFIVEAGEGFVLDPALLADLDHSGIRMSVASVNSINADFLARSLADYPYRCSEQTTSRAMGLLLGQNLGYTEEWVDMALNQAIVSLQNRRGSSGLVSLWSSYGSGDMFLHAYASDFLSMAEERGVENVTELRKAFVQSLARNLERAEDPYYNTQVSLGTKAYSLAVMARAGQANIAAQRLLFDTLIKTPGETLAKAALAVAADAVGDQSDRDALLEDLNTIPVASERGTIVDFGTGFRDQLAALALLAESDLIGDGAGQTLLSKRLPTLTAALADQTLTTQEEAWALRLAEHLGQGSVAFIAQDGTAQTEATTQALDVNDFDGAQAITNTGEDPLLVSIWQAGAPQDTSVVIADGVTIHRFVRDLDTLLPVDEPAPGQRMLVSLVGTAFADENLDYVVADLLPAGYEVEQTGLPASVMIVGGQVGQCPSGKASLAPAVCTLGDDMGFQQSGTEYAEARADRVLFGFQTGKGQFAHHYVVRRTQGGLVTQPGAYIEAMYAPDIRARSAARQLR